ncbi:serine hydrolase domain-containing protein [Chryseobacterium polytrichastri]|uniref:Beta-lactamase n=1 Tax=Chryseobacterium polytrichastri TaxID=1302687 RepID=A0A1M6R8V6_9FLAO|nr:serine hydrolase domain-containing protein [Chryseobacterium polytrichastri]SHK28903.1 Beta-lactamase [Chryseobacterium polytrichastri]
MKFRLPFIAILFSVYCLSQNIVSNVDAIVNTEMKERKIPGMQIAVVQNGKIVLNKSYGVASIQNDLPVKNTSIFPINSTTKVFTAVAVMQLVEQGKIGLSEPISKYLENLPSEWQKITVEQLMTHISGLPDILSVLDPATGSLGAMRTENVMWEKIKLAPLNFKTGERLSYNQTNYYLLGKIIEKVSGDSFVNFVTQNQFNRVGMKNTQFGDSRSIIPNYAPTYRGSVSKVGEKIKNAIFV